MYAKGKGSNAPSDGQAREKLALYVYEYLLHIGAQKSAQTFLSEIRWEKNITLGEPPGFLHAWWCVFWDLYCAAPDRRETCEHSSEVFHDYPFMSPRFPGGLRPPVRMLNQPPVGVPGPQPLLPSAMDPASRPQGPPAMGPIQLMTSPRGMTGMAPQNYGGGMKLPPGSLTGPGMPAMNTGPGVRGPWPNMNANSVPYSSSSPGSYGAPSGAGGPPGTPLMPSPGDSTNSSESIYLMNPIGPPGSRPSFSMGLSPEGPMAGMGAAEPHHVNGSLGAGEVDGMSKNSPSSMGSLTNPPAAPTHEDGEMASSFLNPFQSESVRACVERRPRRGRGSRGARGARGGRGALWQDRTGPATPTANDAISYWKQGQMSEL
ncbi:single-stranded DNA-binding protein 4 isoform X2 [Rhineura floridana]|uniref:single-stranded DNA-binding protein 4 isoform X2 n=1 Tax=Rhineura floridana TaxID=261503 RepID=UPI002AC88660|nr:single-stranded DNA-binding protein 4 isoform X2 [Rhineura floridana]